MRCIQWWCCPVWQQASRDVAPHRDRNSTVPLARQHDLRHDSEPRYRPVPAQLALVVASLPRRLELSAALIPLERAIGACSALQSRLGSIPFQDNMIRVESKLDALAMGSLDGVPGALLRLMIVEASQERPAPRDLRTVTNVLDAFRHGLAVVQARGRAGLTLSLLGDMHQLLRTGSPATAKPANPAGTVVLGAQDAPSSGLPAFDPELGGAMQDLERFMTDPPPLPLAVRMALAMARLELLEPFNGASAILARLLMPLMAVADGLAPVFLAQTLASRRGAHDVALADLARDKRWEDWICFFLSCMTDAADAASARLERTERLRLHREAEMVSLRSDSTARRLIELAFGFPVLTVGAAQEMLEVSFQTANAAVATLVRLGILAPHSNIRRNRVFIFGETLSMLTGAEAALAG